MRRGTPSGRHPRCSRRRAAAAVQRARARAHQDYCPGNAVFRNGLPCGLIDFDLSRPTTRVADYVDALF